MKKPIRNNVNLYEKHFPAILAFYKSVVPFVSVLNRPCISKGNIKTGKIPSVSLLPYVTCPKCCVNDCAKGCYAVKMLLRFKSVFISWSRNTAIALNYPLRFWQCVNRYLARVNPAGFRFHVSGDIPNKDYLEYMISTAAANPQTRFLAFTRRYEWVNAVMDRKPDNLQILFSKGRCSVCFDNPHNLPTTEIITDLNNHNATFVCPGNCALCLQNRCGCWYAKTNETIGFIAH